ncbi:D-alanyl-D-alanine carboxypeptidase family protein [Microbacterium elymi]|uniref:D-alanyl-D-alanine carboxypeptidase n=1 Tax=Microbacterium elymi TaxID=2909587 RepID=A0ABY5NH65_9MICO|nr:D-alanyl-D-alanine carboxypeptidase [Microbacterium elymi]UUT34528.1 D-alanyl-D-alanine carboxypeptidase [Microbacterium elymi]
MPSADVTPDPPVASPGATGEPAASVETGETAEPAASVLDLEKPDDAALRWWDGGTLTAVHIPGSLDMSTSLPASVSLLAVRPRRSLRRPGVLVPLGLVVLLVAAYCTTMALWPLNAVAPTIAAVTVTPHGAAAASLAWPKAGAAGVAVEGFGAPLASTTEQSAIASITKVVTALVVLDKSPVTAKDQGPTFTFTYADNAEYWSYLRNNESALDVPIGGSLTQYQLLEGMLIGSASNYAARLADTWWGSDQSFAVAANGWLDEHDVTGITIADPTGFNAANTATPAALIQVARLAMDDPTIAEIVAKKSVKLPGAGTVKNTNDLLADPDVVGMKTGTLDGYNLLAVKDLKIGDVSLQIDAVALNQPDSDARWAAVRSLFAQVDTQSEPTTSVAAGTPVGTVHTAWGASAPVVTASDADLVVWNSAKASAKTQLRLGTDWDRGAHAGTLTVSGPVNAATVDTTLAAHLDGPGFWWRVTHPIELLGWFPAG